MAKTTTVHSLGDALGERGLRTLLVDLDPQACLTWSTGTDPDSLERSLHDVLLGRCAAADALIKVGDVHLLPSTIDVAGAEVHLLSKTGREYVLRRALEPLVHEYDAILVDCPPSLGICTINGLTAASEVLIPLQCETLSQRGVGQLLETVDDVRSRYGLDVLDPPVPKSVRVAEAPGRGRSILTHSPSSKVADAYRQLAKVIFE